MEISNTTTEAGAVQEVDRICGSNESNYPLKAKIARFNQTLDDFTSLSILYDKSWHYDDANKFDHDPSPFASPLDVVLRNLPVATTKINAGQQDYPFDLRLRIIKGIFFMDSNGVYHELEEETDMSALQRNRSGTPKKFMLMGGSVLLDYIPDFDREKGLKIFFGRNASYFKDTDTTKELGIPNLFHLWACRKVALPFMIKHKLPDKNDIAALILKDEEAIKDFLTNRNATRKPRMRPAMESNK